MGNSDYQTLDMETALSEMPAGRLIMAVNRRLAMELKGRYDRKQAASGSMAWESAATVSWSDWIQTMFQELADHGNTDQVLLTTHQSRTLWEQIIQQFDRDSIILRSANSARLAAEAWGLIHTWEITTPELSAAASSETGQFLEWADEYQRKCRRQGWTDSARLPAVVSHGLQAGNLTPPAEIVLAGFDEITPQQDSLLQLLLQKGCRINTLTPDDQPGSARRVLARDPDQELEMAARWALGRLQLNSNSRIGVVVPQLTEQRSRLESAFRRCFHPGSILPGSTGLPVPYNISLGVPLQQCPLVLDAFLLLHLATGQLPSGDISRLLRSPFLSGWPREQQSRARLDAYLRSRVGERYMSLDTLIRKGREYSHRDGDSCQLLLQALEAFRLQLDHLPARQSPQKWVDQFNTLLANMGWPCLGRLNSREYQQAEAFKQALGSFQTLGQVQGSMTLPDALARLRSLAGETLFQPKAEEAPVQILGILEASGLRFDHLWVIGLSDDNWPPAAHPNPLLPIALQRSMNLPHASPQREYDYAAAITGRLLASAAEVVVSHAASDGESELRVSPLVAGLGLASEEHLELAEIPDERRLGFGTAQLEQIQDHMAPALEPGSHVSGGSGLLADQSACPFRAFANHRLGTMPVEDPVSGVDARIKGIMVHRVLQQVWEELGSRDALLEMDLAGLQQLVESRVAAQLTSLRASRPETLAPRFMQIEQERVTQLILQWLELEREREPFTIHSLEQPQRVEIGGLNLDLVADRVDRLPDGRHMIIDYKTGRLRHRGWFEPRIEEPQLPLYATTDEARVAGVFLAGVSRAHLGFAGVAEDGDLVPGIKAFATTREAREHAGWEGLLSDWHESLEQLASEVLQGQAGVTPKSRNRDCQYCSLTALCRVHEQEVYEDRGEQGE
jgi:ATP-dependent helicase/nuclease subunit B